MRLPKVSIQLADGASVTARIEGLWNTTLLENQDDCVISSLSCALQAAKRRHGKHCADALRLAIAVTLLGLRSETRNSVASDEPGSTQRQIRALQKWRLKRVVEYVEIISRKESACRIWLLLQD